MKKTYIQPVVQTTKISINSNILTTSGPEFGGNATSDMDAESRGYDRGFWDDEE